MTTLVIKETLAIRFFTKTCKKVNKGFK